MYLIKIFDLKLEANLVLNFCDQILARPDFKESYCTLLFLVLCDLNLNLIVC